MLRTHRHGNEGGFRWQDHLENYVNEATSKRKGEFDLGVQKRKVFNLCLFNTFLGFFSDVYGDRYS